MIQLTIPNIGDAERKAVDECLRSGWVSTAGPQVKEFEEAIAEYTGSKYAVALNSGSAALFLLLKSLGVSEGDWVIVPDWTFVATANAVVQCGARPLFVDVTEASGQLDLELLGEFLSVNSDVTPFGCIHKESKANIRFVLPVHTLGASFELNKLAKICKRFNISIIEDAAASIGTKVNGVHAGTFGVAGCLSFNGNKVMTTGSGGAVITNDKALAEKIKHLSLQARPDKENYFHDEVGYNLRMNSMSAALGLAQLSRMPEFLESKKRIHDFYSNALKNISEVQLFPKLSDESQTNHWVVSILTDKASELRKHLKENSIESSGLWSPLHELPMFQNDLFITNKNISSELYQKAVMLPCSTSISNEELETVAGAIRKFYS